MAILIESGKRTHSFDEDSFCGDHRITKRCRFEALIEAAGDNSNASPEQFEALAAAAVGASSIGAVSLRPNNFRRRLHEDVDGDVDEDVAPHDKRVRVANGGGTASASSGADAGSSGGEADVRRWSEKAVRSLHGCPSVEVALQRCSSVLNDFHVEVKQSVSSELEIAKQKAEAEAATNGGQKLDQMNRVLRRTIQHLAKRCSKLATDGTENESLRQALEQTQDEKSRLVHSNAVLQAHIRIQLDDVPGGHMSWAH